MPGSKFVSDKQGATIINGRISFTNLTSYPYKTYWTFGDGDSADVLNPVHNYDSVGSFRVMLISETMYGCIDTAFKDLSIMDEFTFYAPTAFSPGLDGANDYFYVMGNGMDETSFKMIVYDRWGEKVFETSRYDNSNPQKYGWDGSIKGKTLGVPGVYTWMVKYKDKLQQEHQQTGIITLIR